MDMDPGLAQHLDRGHDHLNPTHPTTPDRKNPVDKPAQTGSTNTPTTKTDTKPTIRSIRHSQTPHIGGSRVRGDGGVRPRGPVAISGLRNGTWRALGHTYPRPSGTFRFVAPRNVTRVRAEYGGDTVTEKSQARARVERISTSSSS